MRVSIFLLTQLSQILFVDGSIGYTLVCFLWTACIATVLYILNRKQSQNLKDASKNNLIRKCTGVLTIINGLMYLPTVIWVLITDLQSLDKYNNKFADNDFAAYAVILLVIICQVIFGLYLLRCRKQNASSEEDRNSILGISLLFSLFAGIFSILNYNPEYFVWKDIVWFVLFIAILTFLYLSNRKQGPKSKELFKKPIIRKSAGALIIINGSLMLPDAIILTVMRIITYKQYSDLKGMSYSNPLHNSIFLPLLQILIGIYLLKSRKQISEVGGEIIE